MLFLHSSGFTTQKMNCRMQKKKKKTLKKIYSYCNSSVARNVNFNLPENLKQVSEYQVSSLLSSLSFVKKAKNWSHQVPFVDAWWPF